MCTDRTDKKIDLLKTYFQECSKYEHHYSVTRSALTTFLIFMAVAFGSGVSLEVESLPARLSAFILITVLLLFSAVLSLYFQKLTAGCTFAQSTVGAVLSDYLSTGQEEKVDNLLAFWSAPDLIKAHMKGASRRDHWPADIPAQGAKIAKFDFSDGPNRIAFFVQAVVAISFFCIIFLFSDASGSIVVSDRAGAQLKMRAPVLVSADGRGLKVLQKGVAEASYSIQPGHGVRQVCIMAGGASAEDCWHD